MSKQFNVSIATVCNNARIHHRIQRKYVVKKVPDEKICPICSRSFETLYDSKVYCSNECIKASQKKTVVVTKRVNKENNLATINAKARELGMHYGEYVALMERGKI